MIKKILLAPLQRFVQTESLSGILLFGATLVALAWANSPFGESYVQLWQYKLGFSIHDFKLEKPLILWINDGLMAIFFFLIGLELKRELIIGELDSIQKAAFPVLAALGGVIFPIGLFLLLNDNPQTATGWGIPMATDIAFALAIIKLLGDRIPLGLKVFLTAFAIIDDIAAVVVIALFYSATIHWSLLVYALIILAVLGILSYRRIYLPALFLILGIVVWFLFLKSGIHPTIAGVLLAFTIPIRQKINLKNYLTESKQILASIQSDPNNENNILSKAQIIQIENLESQIRKVQSPLQDLEYKIHHWVAYFIMPIFALANAGVIINSQIRLDIPLATNIALGLLLGKFLGISIVSYLGLKLKLTTLPIGVKFKQILGVSVLAGVGFTMSIFISGLAFTSNQLYNDSAKIGILAGSLVAGLLGYLILLRTSPLQQKRI